MRVETAQLVPGCILLKEVFSKTNSPIIPKMTVLTDIHIEFLEAFLIETVEVSPRLSSGEVFKPKVVVKTNEVKVKPKKEIANITFLQQLQQAVEEYKRIFNTLQSGVQLDILKIRELIIPLLERTNEMDKMIPSIHQFGNKKDYIFYHSVAVGILSSYIARKLGLEKGEWLQIGIAGLLSDCGMAKVNPNILFKEGPLHSFELAEIKKHPTYSYRLVEKLPTLTKGGKLAILQHHERLDGSGYPLGVSNEKIHLYAQLIAISDTYHAMTSDRLYKKAQSPYKVIEEIEKNKYTKFNPEIVQVFSRSIANFSKGTKVELSNKQVGEVIFVDPKYPTRPIIRLEHTGEIIVLQSNQTLYIERTLS